MDNTSQLKSKPEAHIMDSLSLSASPVKMKEFSPFSSFITTEFALSSSASMYAGASTVKDPVPKSYLCPTAGCCTAIPWDATPFTKD